MSEEPAKPTASASLPAFSGYGIELEYMIVQQEDLSVLPIADRLLRHAAGDDSGEVDRGLLGWSNEMVLHLIELKNARPVPSLRMLPDAFQSDVRHINELLQNWQACLMPSAMHPWMDPRGETHLWPHNNRAIYSAYDRIFDSKSHGWSNLQSMHINLPFDGDEEFARLHAAIRLVLPILPALAASSPLADGGDTGYADYRMHVYCGNSQAVPSIAAMIVPETVSSRTEYEQAILAPMYRDTEAFDPEGVLRREWLNSRGAIARFDRNAIEIRVIDTQECPQADMAIAAATVFAVRMLYEAGRSPGQATLAAQQAISTLALADILQACIRDAERAVIDNPRYLALLGFPERRCSANMLWQYLIERMHGADAQQASAWQAPLQVILDKGPLARRILRAIDTDYSRTRLQAVYRELCVCLQEGRMFAA